MFASRREHGKIQVQRIQSVGCRKNTWLGGACLGLLFQGCEHRGRVFWWHRRVAGFDRSWSRLAVEFDTGTDQWVDTFLVPASF